MNTNLPTCSLTHLTVTAHQYSLFFQLSHEEWNVNTLQRTVAVWWLLLTLREFNTLEIQYLWSFSTWWLRLDRRSTETCPGGWEPVNRDTKGTLITVYSGISLMDHDSFYSLCLWTDPWASELLLYRLFHSGWAIILKRHCMWVSQKAHTPIKTSQASAVACDGL